MWFVLHTATQAWRQKFAKIANDHPNMSFAVADEEENSDLFSEFGFDDSSEEVNVGIIGPNDRKYPMEPMEEFDSDDVEKFLRRFMKGTLCVISLLCTEVQSLSVCIACMHVLCVTVVFQLIDVLIWSSLSV